MNSTSFFNDLLSSIAEQGRQLLDLRRFSMLLPSEYRADNALRQTIGVVSLELIFSGKQARVRARLLYGAFPLRNL